jgi:hypothetical protein
MSSRLADCQRVLRPAAIAGENFRLDRPGDRVLVKDFPDLGGKPFQLFHVVLVNQGRRI